MIADLLFEIAWKSTIVAGAVIALLFAMRGQHPSARVAVGGLGMSLLLLLPAIVALLTLLPTPVIEMTAPAPASTALIPLAVDPVPAQLAIDSSYALAAEPAGTVSPSFLAVLIWSAGALAIALRLLAGLATLSRWARRAEPIEPQRAATLLRASGAPDRTALLISPDIAAPLSWGWRNPAILVKPETLANAAEAKAVVAHEAAHLARGDWPRLIAARAVVALFWFNPFVWLLERLYLQDIEEAADAEATQRVEPAQYAQALLNVARNAAVPAGANSIASGALSKRIHSVLRRRPRSRFERTWRVGALASVGMVAGPIALVQFVAPAMSVAAEPAIAPVAAVAGPSPADGIAAPHAVAAPRAIAALPPAAIRPASPGAAPLLSAVDLAPTAPLAVAVAVQAPAAPRAPEEIDSEEIERVARASEEIRKQSVIIARDSARIAARARAEAAVAMANARKDMLRGADEMDRGAIEMRRSAARMREEARKLRDPAYRAKVIAEARANRGKWSNKNWDYKVPTDQELIDAIPKMEEGARNMDAGVEKMREGARKMRESASKQGG